MVQLDQPRRQRFRQRVNKDRKIAQRKFAKAIAHAEGALKSFRKMRSGKNAAADSALIAARSSFASMDATQ